MSYYSDQLELLVAQLSDLRKQRCPQCYYDQDYEQCICVWLLEQTQDLEARIMFLKGQL